MHDVIKNAFVFNADIFKVNLHPMFGLQKMLSHSISLYTVLFFKKCHRNLWFLEQISWSKNHFHFEKLRLQMVISGGLTNANIDILKEQTKLPLRLQINV